MSIWTFLAAAVFAVAVAVASTAVARRLLGAPVGWVRGLVVGIGFYAILSPVLNRAVSAGELVDPETFEFVAAPEAIAAVMLLALVWAFLLTVAVLLIWQVLVPAGTVRDPVTWVRDTIAARRRIVRYAQIGSVITKHGVRQLARRDPRTDESQELGHALANVLQDAGVTFVKFGQVLSTRSDVLPPQLVAPLASLQSDVAPEPWESLVVVVDQDNPTWRERIEIDETPLAAASIGQVHRGRLSIPRPSDDDDDDEGAVVEQRVVIKIQRPEAKRQVTADVDILQRLTRSLTASAPWAKDMDAEGLARGFSTALIEELDYRREAENMRLVAAATQDTGVRVPRVYVEESAPRVIVMEEIEGVTLDRAGEFLATLEPTKRAELANTLMTSVLHQILVSGIFHADLHPGNVVVTPDGGLALLDFGSVGILDREMREILLGLLAAFDADDPDTAVALLLRLMPPGDYDSYALTRDLGQAMTVMAGGAGLSPDSISLLFDVFRKHRLAIPPTVAAALRTAGSLQGCLEILDPSADLMELVSVGTREAAGAILDADEVSKLVISRGIALVAGAQATLGTLDAAVRDVARGVPIRSALTGLAAVARGALAEIIPTAIACALILAAVGLLAIPGGAMITPTISWATYLAGVVGAAGTALILRTLFRQAS